MKKRWCVICIMLLIFNIALASCGGSADLDDESSDDVEEMSVDEDSGSGSSEDARTIFWEDYTVPVKFKDGYTVNKGYHFGDSWVDCDDTATIDSLCSELGIDSMISPDDIEFIGPTVADGTETPRHCVYLFGYINGENTTEGWDITEDNMKDLLFYVGMKQEDGGKNEQDKVNMNSAITLFYTNSNETYYFDNPDMGFYRNTSKSGVRGLSFVMHSNDTGNLPFVITVYSPKNPNYPDGDKWYTDYSVGCWGEGSVDDFYFTPSDF